MDTYVFPRWFNRLRAVLALALVGITAYVVDGGGDIRLRGAKPGGAWTVGIQDPRRPGKLYAGVSPAGGSIVTSGDYQQYFERDGVRYHHILDPATGRPARGSFKVPLYHPHAA